MKARSALTLNPSPPEGTSLNQGSRPAPLNRSSRRKSALTIPPDEMERTHVRCYEVCGEKSPNPCKSHALIFTCEHATNTIPKVYQPLFKNAQGALNSHRGYDPGAIEVATSLAKQFNAPLLYGKASRLLVELNRTLKHPKLWSEFTMSLSETEKQKILNTYYLPYRDQLIEQIKSFHREGKSVLHVSVHSFTPVLNGVTRNADIGLLYDPSRKREKEFCLQWQQRLEELSPNLRVRRNYPYLGRADGMVTFLRKQFDGESYLGIELEVNQAMSKKNGNLIKIISLTFFDSIYQICK